MKVNYANGYNYNATQRLIINGADKAAVMYPKTGSWGTFSKNIIEVPVELQAGSNTIKLLKDMNYAEIDYIEFVYNDRATIEAVDPPTLAYTTGNLALNNDFETGGATQTPANWSTWSGSNGTDGNADYVEAGGYNGGYRLTHCKSTAYEVYTDQTQANLQNGTYTLKAWVSSGGGQISNYVDAKNYGGTAMQVNVPVTGANNWTQIQITGINVTNGQCTIGLYSKGNAGNWCSIDNVVLYKQ